MIHIFSEAYHQHSTRKFKTIDSEPEPSYTEIGNRRKLTLLVTASSQYCQYSMPIRTVVFKDTPLYKSRTYRYKFAIGIMFMKLPFFTIVLALRLPTLEKVILNINGTLF